MAQASCLCCLDAGWKPVPRRQSSPPRRSLRSRTPRGIAARAVPGWPLAAPAGHRWGTRPRPARAGLTPVRPCGACCNCWRSGPPTAADPTAQSASPRSPTRSHARLASSHRPAAFAPRRGRRRPGRRSAIGPPPGGTRQERSEAESSTAAISPSLASDMTASARINSASSFLSSNREAFASGPPNNPNAAMAARRTCNCESFRAAARYSCAWGSCRKIWGRVSFSPLWRPIRLENSYTLAIEMRPDPICPFARHLRPRDVREDGRFR